MREERAVRHLRFEYWAITDMKKLIKPSFPEALSRMLNTWQQKNTVWQNLESHLVNNTYDALLALSLYDRHLVQESQYAISFSPL